MFKKLTKILTLTVAALGLTGCGFLDVTVSPTEVAYVYKTDIYESERYNPGNDYIVTYPFESKRQILVLNYGTFVEKFDIKYTLTDKENKTTVESTAYITYKLMKSPNDSKDLKFSDDKNAQYFTSNFNAQKGGENRLILNPELIFKRSMNETMDKVFREEYTNLNKYPDFNSIESSVVQMQKAIKKKLTESALNSKIEIIGVKIESPVVPDPIQTSRNNMLRLKQNALNDIKELEIKSNQASARMAVDVREAINDVTLDRIAGEVDKGYLLIKTFNRAIDEKSPLNLTITPDLMRYLEKDNKQSSKGTNNLIDTYNKMTDQELQEYFSRSSK